jgi:putative thiamine transport system permease protein
LIADQAPRARRQWAMRLPAAALAIIVGLPLLWALAVATQQAFNAAAWVRLWHEPGWMRALGYTLWTGLTATLLAVFCTTRLLQRSFFSPVWAKLLRQLPPMLAIPHVAFALGLMALLAPSGWLLRAVSPWLTGLTSPPLWPTTQDPWGIGFIAALTLKEIPFLLWTAATQLQRAEISQRLTRDLQIAQSMGYSHDQAWSRVLWPQIGPRLRWPLLAVLAYSLTVVDLAQIAGPQAPPTLAVLIWGWLQDADPAQAAVGAVGAWLLAALLALLVIAWAWLSNQSRRMRHRVNGLRGGAERTRPVRLRSSPVALGLAVLYGLVGLALLAGSVSGIWAFPQLLPQHWTYEAWISVFSSATTLATTLWLALASAATALLWSVAWLECAPTRWDAILRRWIYLPLLLPGVLWVLGVHAVTLHWRIDAQATGLWLAHSLAVLPYVLIALNPAYVGFDPRLRHIAASVNADHIRFLLQIKWPLLKASLASSFGVGFAVSVAQYLPTLYIGGGRFATVTTEAVTLASGAQRSLTSAYAVLQWLLPVLAFAFAAWIGRPRQFSTHTSSA